MSGQDIDNLSTNWEILLTQIEEMVGKRPTDLNGVLFLIGVQELGKGARHFSKEQKQDLLHIGVCRVLSLSGHYKLAGLDRDGWPHYDVAAPVPYADLLMQEDYLKVHVLRYFDTLFAQSL